MGIAEIGTDYGGQGNAYPKRGTKKVSGEDGTVKQDLTREEMFRMISERSQEIYEKIKNNDTEPSFQIGSQSFTIKEWDKLLEQFDIAQKEIREKMKEEQAKRQKEVTTRVSVEKEVSVTAKDSKDIAKAAGLALPEAAQAVTEGADKKSVMDSLVTESTTCTYPASGEEESDKQFITWYTEEGIFCREAGQTSGYFFHVPFEDSSQYEKVIDFLKQLPSDADMRFAASKIFWQGFLEGRE